MRHFPLLPEISCLFIYTNNCDFQYIVLLFVVIIFITSFKHKLPHSHCNVNDYILIFHVPLWLICNTGSPETFHLQVKTMEDTLREISIVANKKTLRKWLFNQYLRRVFHCFAGRFMTAPAFLCTADNRFPSAPAVPCGFLSR